VARRRRQVDGRRLDPVAQEIRLDMLQQGRADAWRFSRGATANQWMKG
jgi:hypothetical protein